MNKIWAWVAGVGGVIVVLGAMGWGVPYYIKSEVTVQVNATLTAAGIETIDDTADANKAAVSAVLQRLDSIENRMIARDELFMQYLERQAN